MLDFLEALWEILGEGVLSLFRLSSVWTPKKEISPKKQKTLEILFTVVAFAAYFSIPIGASLLVYSHGQSVLGWCFLAFFFLFVAVYTLLRILHTRKSRRR